MDTESLLLLFEERHPCWTRRMFEAAGRSVEETDTLIRQGNLRRDGDVYSLTADGAERFRRTAEESYLPLRPGIPEPNMDKRREADRSLLELLLDKRHLQRWGLKEYEKPFRFEVPDLRGVELFTRDGRKPVWRYHESDVFRKMTEDFPVTGMAARDFPAPEAVRVVEWTSAFMPKRRAVTTDLLYKSRYDFQAYAHFPQLPCDPCRMRDTDRFFFFFAPAPVPENEDGMLTTLGEFHMYLTMLRRMLMPGYVDRDSLDQDGINWLFYVYEREEDARACEALLSPLGDALAGPATPLEVRSLSLQALWEYGETAETIHDLWPVVTHPIFRLS